MSAFPRLAPRAAAKVNKTYRNLFVGSVTASPLIAYGMGEYCGWWDKYKVPAEGTPERDLYDIEQKDKDAMNLFLQSQLIRTTSEKIKRLEEEHFRQNMAVGVKLMIKNEEGLSEEEVEVQKSMLEFNAPDEKIQGKNLVAFTSTKKSAIVPTESSILSTDKQQTVSYSSPTPTSGSTLETGAKD